MKISLIIPVYNEAESVRETLQGLLKVVTELPCESELIVVNDGSTDQSQTVLDSVGGIRVVRHARNRGYGASLKTGSRLASGDLVIFFDADGQHDPTQLGMLLAAMGEADMVVGARQGVFHSQPWRLPGKWLLSKLANYLSKQKIPDLNSGFRAIRRSVLLQYLHLCPDQFSFTSTLTMALFAENHDIVYVPIHVRPRTGKSSVTVATGFETLLLLLRLITLFNPMRVFLPTSVVLMIFGVGWSSIYIWRQRGLSVGGGLLIMTSVLMFFVGLIADQVAAIRREMYRRDQH